MAKSGAKKGKPAKKDVKKVVAKGAAKKGAARRRPKPVPFIGLTAREVRDELEKKCQEGEEMPKPYPRYCVTVDVLGKDHVMTGTHDGIVLSSDPPFRIDLEHLCTVKGLPNVRILLKKP